jgi:hypothetical protein
MLYEWKFEYAFMIKPGLLTASTSSADHFGMSADCLVCLSIVVSPSFGLVLLKGELPPRSD